MDSSNMGGASVGGMHKSTSDEAHTPVNDINSTSNRDPTTSATYYTEPPPTYVSNIHGRKDEPLDVPGAPTVAGNQNPYVINMPQQNHNFIIPQPRKYPWWGGKRSPAPYFLVIWCLAATAVIATGITMGVKASRW